MPLASRACSADGRSCPAYAARAHHACASRAVVADRFRGFTNSFLPQLLHASRPRQGHGARPRRRYLPPEPLPGMPLRDAVHQSLMRECRLNGAKQRFAPREAAPEALPRQRHAAMRMGGRSAESSEAVGGPVREPLRSFSGEGPAHRGGAPATPGTRTTATGRGKRGRSLRASWFAWKHDRLAPGTAPDQRETISRRASPSRSSAGTVRPA